VIGIGLTVAVLATFIVLPFALRLARRCVTRWLGRMAERTAAIQAGVVCVCGYDLAATDMARCPECGRVTHFFQTAEELGLTANELQRLSEAKRRRQAGSS
jgi:hypothetical protein